MATARKCVFHCRQETHAAELSLFCLVATTPATKMALVEIPDEIFDASFVRELFHLHHRCRGLMPVCINAFHQCAGTGENLNYTPHTGSRRSWHMDDVFFMCACARASVVFCSLFARAANTTAAIVRTRAMEKSQHSFVRNVWVQNSAASYPVSVGEGGCLRQRRRKIYGLVGRTRMKKKQTCYVETAHAPKTLAFMAKPGGDELHLRRRPTIA